MADKLVEECINVIDGDTMYNETLTVASSNNCASFTPYIVLFIVFLLISSLLGGVFIYYRWYKNRKNDVPAVTYSMSGNLDY